MIGNELAILSGALLIVFFFLLGILLYLIIRKLSENARNQKISKLTEKYFALIFIYMTDQFHSRSIRSDSKLQKEALEQALGRYAEVLEGESEKYALRHLAELHLSGYYAKRLKSAVWSQRMNALYYIEDFQMMTLREDVIRLLRKKKISREEIVHSLRVLASFRDKRLFELLSNDFDHLTDYEYRAILSRLDKEGIDLFMLSFYRIPEQLKFAVLDVLGTSKEIHYLSFVETIYGSYSGEIRLRALKTIAAIGYVKDINTYLPLSDSSVWQERMFFAKLLGSSNDRKGIPYLVTFLHDDSWWVRSQAGQALSSFSNSRDIFLNVLRQSQDPYARDMAEEWLSRGEGI
ncbi:MULTISPECIES: HEAT repeat domain-containing protein [unclassified Bacillus (in: firmicutes)]|uniref:HEAT repeat domain-containing protein n=1 Tax=unclassified Bacillus (in: firmicutes) TaxID=185979 RepID=UPI0008EB8D23|nr:MULTISPECIES: HEAT repeat domain-containing protein [unclassified Bacillus (in: firmicutes)]SFA81073.1 HEAT repeat [Bacillus sp. UNCCL13]SFQ71212.1 HEAT repeat [Bacillus sp. cl95]